MSRARSNLWVWLAAFLLGGFVAPTPGAAQVEPPPTVTPADTLPPPVLIPVPPAEISPDTLPGELATAAESRANLATVPEWPSLLPAGWYAGRWHLTRAELVRLPGLNVLELIQTLPGITRFRAGGFGRPEGLTASGMGGGRLRVFLDGFELDPLGSGAYPLETISLLDLRSVRVERSVSEIRVELETFRLADPAPHSAVELGTGVYQTRLLRAIFSRGFGDRLVGTAGIDIANTAGIGIREEYGQASNFVRGSYALDDATGLQIEWRRAGIDRAGNDFPEESLRSDLLLRGRRRIAERFVVEATVGRSGVEKELDADAGVATVRLASTQAALRAAYASERASAEATSRLRYGDADQRTGAALEIEARAGVQPLAALRVEGIAKATGGDEPAAEGTILTAWSPLAAVTVFGSLSAGSRSVSHFVWAEDFPEQSVPRFQNVPFIADAAGWRAGAEWAGTAGSVGAAVLDTGLSPIAPFGLPFDLGTPTVEAPAAIAVEGYGSLAVPGTHGAIRAEGWYSRFIDPVERPFAPRDVGRAAIVLHDIFYGGQLEPSLRVEGVLRGITGVPAEAGAAPLTYLPGYRTLHLALNIRILDVTAFLVWDNLLNEQKAMDLPGVPAAFPRMVYGASWQFRN